MIKRLHRIKNGAREKTKNKWPNGFEFKLLGGFGEFQIFNQSTPNNAQFLHCHISSISKNVLCLSWTGEIYFGDKRVGGNYVEPKTDRK